jgi:LacI family transcriptional regulator
MSVTIRDVAEAAGVSAMSVSKVLHGKGPNVRVSAETAEAIRRAAESLNYHANTLARNFREQKTATIGVLFEHHPECASQQYFAEILEGVVSAAFARNYTVSLCPSLIASESIHALSDGRFDGFVWCRIVSTQDRLQAVRKARVPVVILHEPPEASDDHSFSHVTCDNERGLDLAVEHLSQLGHRCIGFVAARDFDTNQEIQVRQRAFLKAMSAHNLAEFELLEWGLDCESFSDWWRSPSKATALIFWAEVQAIRCLERAAEVGVSVPDELSVVGFDSTIRCEITRPTLSAIRQPLLQMAGEATKILINTIEDAQSTPIHSIHPCQFDARESTARPSSTLRKL